MKVDLKEEIELVAGVTAQLVDNLLIIKGAKGEVKRSFQHPKVKLSVEEQKVIIESIKATKREKTIVGAFYAHIKNMVYGVQEPYVYKLKICSGHFPMNVAVVGQEVVIKNFLGENVPRRAKLVAGAEVKITGNDIVVSSPDKELAGLMAARIENLCRITNRDLRIFQDGCYITEKGGHA